MDTRLVRIAGILAVATLGLAACSDAGDQAKAKLQGLRTVVYAAPDLKRAKDWYSRALGIEPYFDEAYYVGFNVGGFELALDPSRPVTRPAGTGPVAYWGVDDVEGELKRLVGLGATLHAPFQDVGGGVQVGTVLDPFGNALGLIYNPRFEIDD